MIRHTVYKAKKRKDTTQYAVYIQSLKVKKESQKRKEKL